MGTADGHISTRLSDRYDTVVALDLERVDVDHAGVFAVQADAAALPFADGCFDLVLCAEVLEHVPATSLGGVCSELGRVAKDTLVVGVPYRQDTRVGRTTCAACRAKNPGWGHVNVFDEERLRHLFSWLRLEKTSFVGRTDERTNFLAAWLMDLAGNPYGEFGPKSQCVDCASELRQPPRRSLTQRVFTRLAVYAMRLQKPFVRTRPNWIHMLFGKTA